MAPNQSNIWWQCTHAPGVKSNPGIRGHNGAILWLVPSQLCVMVKAWLAVKKMPEAVSVELLHSSYLEDGKCSPEQLSAHNQCIATQPLSDVTHMPLNRVVRNHMWWHSTSWWHTSSGTVPMAGGFFHPWPSHSGKMDTSSLMEEARQGGARGFKLIGHPSQFHCYCSFLQFHCYYSIFKVESAPSNQQLWCKTQ